MDLRGFESPILAYLEVRAAFDATVAVEEGPSEDPFVVACNEDHAPGGDTAFLAALLEPKQYRVVVDGETVADEGEFELSVELVPRSGRCGAAPPNDRCENAIALDPALEVQTVFGTTECSSDQAQTLWECGDYAERDGEVFYSLDLSQASAPVLLHASTGLAPTNHSARLLVVRDDAGVCSTTFACQDEEYQDPEGPRTNLWALLDPGRYFVAVEHERAPGDFGLRVELGGSCSVSNDTCRTAEPLRAELGLQSLTVWPMCGDDSLATQCNILSPTPDIFYRLDLREFAGPVRVKASANRQGGAYASLVLLEDAGGDCGNELWCGEFDLWLEPRSYVLALDGFRDEQGPVTLEVEIAADSPPSPVDCIDGAVARCAAASDFWCCSGRGEQCALAFRSCGLRESALRCLCDAEPACCGAPGESDECARVLAECGTFCAGFDPAFECPV